MELAELAHGRGVRRGMAKRLSVASDVSWASEVRQRRLLKSCMMWLLVSKYYPLGDYADDRIWRHDYKHVEILSILY